MPSTGYLNNLLQPGAEVQSFGMLTNVRLAPMLRHHHAHQAGDLRPARRLLMAISPQQNCKCDLIRRQVLVCKQKLSLRNNAPSFTEQPSSGRFR